MPDAPFLPKSHVDRIYELLQLDGQVSDGETLLLSVSGGADSVYLLQAFSWLGKCHGWKLYVAHVEHGLRGDASLQDQAFVQSLAQEVGLPYLSRAVDVPRAMAADASLSVESAARKLRYQALEEMREAKGAQHVLLGHHMGDAWETLWMHWLRGSGAQGLLLPLRKGRYVRPLLFLTPQEIRAHLQKQGLTWREDRSNQDTYYTRNWIRHLFSGIWERFPAVYDRFRDYLRIQIAEEQDWEQRLQALDPKLSWEGDRLRISSNLLRSLSLGLRRRFLRRALQNASALEYGARLRDIDRYLAFTETSQGTKLLYVGDTWRLYAEYGDLYVEKTFTSQQKHVTIPKQAWVLPMGQIQAVPGGKIWVRCQRAPLPEAEAFCLPEGARFALRSPQAGEKLRFAYGSRKVSRLLKDAKVPYRLRSWTWILEYGGEAQAVWLPGVGFRRSVAGRNLNGPPCYIKVWEGS